MRTLNQLELFIQEERDSIMSGEAIGLIETKGLVALMSQQSFRAMLALFVLLWMPVLLLHLKLVNWLVPILFLVLNKACLITLSSNSV